MRMPPGLSGVDTIARMWEHAPDLQVVICTAYSDYSWTEILSKLGWTDRLLILKKPFDKVEVWQMALALSVKHQLEGLARMKTEDMRAMMTRRSGAIITIGSLHASLGNDPRLYAPGYRRSTQSYHAAKGAILNLTRALACELAQYDITVNCISPGQIPKPELNAFTRENFRNMVPLGRLGEPHDLKGAVALFASQAGRWITGQNLIVDGGWSAW